MHDPQSRIVLGLNMVSTTLIERSEKPPFSKGRFGGNVNMSGNEIVG